MYHTINLLDELDLVHSSPTLYVVRDDGRSHSSSGTSIPPDEAHARRIAREASRWAAFAEERTRQRPATLQQKALDAACFSVLKRASSLAIPSKLVGVRDHQPKLWGMVRERVPAWTRLDLDVTDERIAALHDGEAVGRLQAKHLGWARPLVPFGARLYLARITGSERSGYTLGVNVVIGHVGEALERLLDALGQAGFGEARSNNDNGSAGGDGVGRTSIERVSVDGLSVGPSRTDGDGAAGDPRLVVPATEAAPEADPSDVVLYRGVDGTARCNVRHAVWHSPSGIEWGYHGSGPADLARSVLLAFTDEYTAERLYQAFKAEVVAAIPRAGGVIRAADVRAWLASRGAELDGDDR